MNEPRESDIAKVIRQEELLVFKSFDEIDAWRLGNLMRAKAANYNQGVVIDIRRGEEILFFTAMPGTNAENANWARRKRNLVNLTHTSSYLTGLQIKFQTPAELVQNLDEGDYAWHGGCFPIRLQSHGVIGTATVSGLPQREDHKLVSDVIADYLGVDLGEFTL